ncbi:adenylate cyclase [Allochromatium warmingii]|uniref:Adenylate cyclase n=2 Tax=Allochromatium warmingii TaxID=61595 RepID=A0A1H3EJA4_ALLWA|nr:adenylate cyclase [Allochromatium warmingii]
MAVYMRKSHPIIGAQATVLIVDLRGFSALMDSVAPTLMVELLNRFFALMAKIVDRHGGLVDKFMGDSVMAVFGVPTRHSDDLIRALNCAIEMQLGMIDLNRQSEARGEPRLYAGIAVSTGDVMAGCFGSEVYNEYTVIGNPVNLASRIEGYALRGQILLSEASFQAAGNRIQIGSVNEVQVKGRSQPVRLYELKAVNEPRLLRVPTIEIRKTPRILVDFPAVFQRVEDKRILPTRLVGQVNDLGYFGLCADLSVMLPPYSEVLMSLAPEFGLDSQVEVYARVLRTQPHNAQFRTNLQFTTIDTPGHRKIKQYIDHILWGS